MECRQRERSPAPPSLGRTLGAAAVVRSGSKEMILRVSFSRVEPFGVPYPKGGNDLFSWLAWLACAEKHGNQMQAEENEHCYYCGSYKGLKQACELQVQLQRVIFQIGCPFSQALAPPSADCESFDRIMLSNFQLLCRASPAGSASW